MRLLSSILVSCADPPPNVEENVNSPFVAMEALLEKSTSDMNAPVFTNLVPCSSPGPVQKALSKHVKWVVIPGEGDRREM